MIKSPLLSEIFEISQNYFHPAHINVINTAYEGYAPTFIFASDIQIGRNILLLRAAVVTMRLILEGHCVLVIWVNTAWEKGDSRQTTVTSLQVCLARVVQAGPNDTFANGWVGSDEQVSLPPTSQLIMQSQYAQSRWLINGPHHCSRLRCAFWAAMTQLELGNV